MRYYFNLLVNLVLLFTTPLLLACPQNEPITVNMPVSLKDDLEKLPTYDDLLEFVDFMEDAEPEDLEKYTPEQLEWMVQFLVSLARNGILAGQEEEAVKLECDIQDLLSNLKINLSLAQNEDYTITPAIFYGQRKVIPCNWFSKKWKHAKHFCQDHKKEIIIGTAVIVAVTGVACLVAASASGAANTLGAAGAAGAAALSNESDHGHKHKHSSHHVSDKKRHASIRKIIVEDMASTIKENHEIKQSILLCDADDANCFTRFQEAVKYAAAKAAHGAVDYTATATSVLPGLMDEIVVARDHLLPESIAEKTKLYSPFGEDDENDLSYTEKHNNNAACVHEYLDEKLPYDLAKDYTSEAKEQYGNGKTLGLLPPPQALKPGAGGILNAEGKYLTRTLASDQYGWKVGQPINNRTYLGKVPKWSTVKKRCWKNDAALIKSDQTYRPEYATPGNIKRMEKGLAPQQFNDRTNQWESMELHHIPPQREGGLFDFIKLWPKEHEAVDQFRHTGH